MQPRIEKTDDGAAAVFTLALPSRAEHVITARTPDTAVMNRVLLREASARKAHTLSRFVFAGCGHYAEFRRQCPGAEGCVVWLQGDACRDGGISSMQSFAVSGTIPTPVTRDGHILGFVYEDEDARWCRLAGVTPPDPHAPREAQTRAVLDILDEALRGHGFGFTDTVRTWFYLDRLLEWYHGFNAVRTAFFNEKGVFGGLLPASTGIGAGNPAGAALSCDLLALQPKHGGVRVQSVPSPLQCPAPDYKSSFSRAVEMEFPTHRTLLVSGTASIAPDGRTVHIGDHARQIELTLDVVDAILRSRGMDWNDISRGIAYFTDMADRALYAQICQARGIPAFPLAMAHADICRDNLLFEIEVDAVRLA